MSSPTSKHVIVGTAGHIDHGKTTLVHRLTGVDTDRLPEEKRRGITIVLGFAPLVLPSGLRVGVVDVPGHERFVKNMVAGAGGIDVAMLIVASDEGVMPQTREHVEICQLLGIKRGLVALTKLDKAGRELAELAAEDVRAELKESFLAEAPIIPVSAQTGEGIDELLATLDRLVATLPPKNESAIAMLPIDRVFSMKGFGSIVTGTLITGSLAVGDAVELMPPVSGREVSETVRIRGIQVFHEKVERAFAGQRTAINLAGVDLEQLALGQLLITPDTVKSTQKIGVQLNYLASRPKPLKTGARVLFHTGTTLVEAGITLVGKDTLDPGESGFAHILLREPIAMFPGQHFIARGFDAVEKAGRTIAGGVIVDPHPGRRRRHAKETTEIMEQLFELVDRGTGEGRLQRALSGLVRERGAIGIELVELSRRLGVLQSKCEDALGKPPASKEVTRVGSRIVEVAAIEKLSVQIAEMIDAFHVEHPFKTGMAIAEVASRVGAGISPEVTERAAGLLIQKKQLVRDTEGLRRPQRAAVGATGGEAKTKVLAALDAAKMEPPLTPELEPISGLTGTAFRDLMSTMVRAGDIVHVAQQLYYGRTAFDEAKRLVLEYIQKNGSMTTAQAKELLGISRKFLIPLLETFDKQNVTVRIGEARKAKAGAK